MNLVYIIIFGFILILPEKTLSQVNGTVEKPARDCSDVWQRNKHFPSGVYTVKPVGAKTAFKVYCKISKVGGWTLIQKHNGQDGLSFEKSWLEYENGFGNLRGEHWLGLEKMHLLSYQKGRKCKLRISLGDFAGNEGYAEYNPFRIGDAKTFYRLSAGTYSGSAGDAFAGNNEIEGDNQRCSRFSTDDKPNDSCWPMCISGGIMFLSCSRQNQAGWWFNACGSANLNGIWREPPNYQNWASSVSWPTWRSGESLKFSEMYLIHE
ncbi:fibrinogen-like protein 1 [Bufo gargarizans]|uniref:fibrinogen-like protein 1 n=1 Tax=Bufo gargarizans TaxID=30331 RepID=UPI001CF357E0|nr:fibrinogen-like protein 1 [Bufo gargarizans]